MKTKNALPALIDVEQLLNFAPAFLIDAFGVLVDAKGAKPGAKEFLERLDAEHKPWHILTNDAARAPSEAAAWYRSCGLPIWDDQVLTSGSMCAVILKERQLLQKKVLVLGPKSSQQMLREDGICVVVPPKKAAEPLPDFDVLVVCDEMGFEFLPTLNLVLSELMKRAAQHNLPPCFVANPDLIYPAGDQNYALAAGSVAALLTHGLAVHHDVTELFEPLGKPAPAVFLEALRRLGHTDAVMLGDTLHTDIAGAKAAGLKAVLVGKTAAELPKNWAQKAVPDALLLGF